MKLVVSTNKIIGGWVEPYIKQWLSVIDGMNNTNTYKLAWGRAIVELCHVYGVNEDPVVFKFEQIGEYVLKYFWNQTYFFDSDEFLILNEPSHTFIKNHYISCLIKQDLNIICKNE